MIIAACVFLVLLLGVVDRLTGVELGFFIFYLIPISILAWHIGRFSAVLMSAASGLIWAWANLEMLQQYSSPFFGFWHAFIRFLSFLAMAVSLSRIKADLDRQMKLNADLSKALAEVKELKGLLAICSSCRRVRDDQGHWQPVEAYLHTHTDVEVSRSLCPECAQKLYPHLFGKDKQA